MSISILFLFVKILTTHNNQISTTSIKPWDGVSQNEKKKIIIIRQTTKFLDFYFFSLDLSC